MTYRIRLITLIILDSIIVLSAIYIASWVVNPYIAFYDIRIITMTAIALLFFHHIFAILFKLYHKVWAYASVGELRAIVQAVTLSVISAGLIQMFINHFTIYRRLLFVTWLLHIILIGGSRFAWRVFRDHYMTGTEQKKRTLIVGAGDAGAMIIRQLNHHHNDSELQPIAIVDDDPMKQRMQVYDLPVLGGVKDIQTIVERKRIEHIVIAIPSLAASDLQKIVDECNKTDAQVQMIPKIEDLMTGRVSVSHLKNVEVEDLLGREPVKLDIEAISQYVTGKVVMVTGAGGSIGSELCRQLMGFHPKQLILLGHGEYSIYEIDQELKEKFGEAITNIIPVIGDVQDRARMDEVIQKYKPAIIYHAAAHKHVPLMEANPHEAVKNNVLGTKNVAEAAHVHHVQTFVLVSTDKAVNPTNVMGATKRIAEMIIQGLNKISDTKFVAVRFGNVLGSRGSVIPVFKRQIARGGPVTVTHPDMTRYFMTIPEASRLVIQAGTLANGGEIYVLDMGEPVKIVDLAKNLIRLSGYSEEEIPIEYCGIRPGEKMYEELLDENEILPNEVYEKIYVGKTVDIDESIIHDLLQEFESYSQRTLKEALMQVVYMERELMKA